MRRTLTLGTLLIGAACLYTYSTNTRIRSRVDKWFGETFIDTAYEYVTDTVARKKGADVPKRIRKVIKPNKFAALDAYAANTPDQYARSFQVLTQYLSKPAKTEQEKARVIFTWLATHIRYDDGAYNSGLYPDQDAKTTLAKRKAVCSGFAALFEELARRMGLEVEQVVGYAKGYGGSMQSKFSDTNHAWNVVKIEGTWQLIDATWGASRSATTAKGHLKSTMSFDPYWFCVKPEAFIFSHLPEDDRWQLTDSRISLRQYEKLPPLDHSFFKLGFDAKDVFQKALSGHVTQFVETYTIKYPVTAVQTPYERKIARNVAHRFVIDSAEEVHIVDDGKWTQLERNGNRFSINYSPKGKKIEVVVKVNSFDEMFDVALLYHTYAPPATESTNNL